MEFKSTSRNAAAVARRESLVANGRTGSLTLISKTSDLALSAGYAPVTLLLSTSPAFQPGRPITVNCSGNFGVIAGGTATAVAVLIQFPDGIPVHASVSFPFIASAGFNFQFTIDDPSVTSLFLYFQLTDRTGTPTTTASAMRFTVTQPAANVPVGTLVIV